MRNTKARLEKLEKALQAQEAESLVHEFSFTVFKQKTENGMCFYAHPSENVTRDGMRALPEPVGIGETRLKALHNLLETMLDAEKQK